MSENRARDIASSLSFFDAPEFREVIGLHKVPHFTTFQKAARRLLMYPRARRLLRKTICIAVKHRRIRRRVALAALDGTGLESHHASSYYVRRRATGGKTWQKTTYIRFPKAGILCDCCSHLILRWSPAEDRDPTCGTFARRWTKPWRLCGSTHWQPTPGTTAKGRTSMPANVGECER